MEFGRLASIAGVDFSLAPLDAGSREWLGRRLKAARATSAPVLRVGAPAWGRGDWVGRLYPPGTPAGQYLTHYARHFDSIELNTTHYRTPTLEQVRKWREQVPEGFRFCPKLIQEVSHRTPLTTELSWTQLEGFVQAVREFESRLGPVFVQFPPHLGRSRLTELLHFCDGLASLARDPGLRWCIELRDPSWFEPEDRSVHHELAAELRDRAIGLVLTDVAGRRDVCHATQTTPGAFVRFVGNSTGVFQLLDPSELPRLTQWRAQLADWAQAGLEEVYFFLHQPDDQLTPETLDAWQEISGWRPYQGAPGVFGAART